MKDKSHKSTKKVGVETPPPTPQQKPAPDKAPATNEDPTDADPFDFGGLPKRDLKKNLGCG